MRADTLTPAERPTLYFIGVSTARSSIQRVFPLWAAALGLDNARLQGIDLPVHAPADQYRRVVDFIARDPLSMGALVTTHKLDLFAATSDRFDEVDSLARMMGETSCISKRGVRLRCHAKDPISGGLALEAFVPPGHWAQTGAEVLSFGAGGSTIAISWYLSRAERGSDIPSAFTTTNRSAARLDHIRTVHSEWRAPTDFRYALTPAASDNDCVLSRLPPGSLVINATGLGKDAPGSPVSDAGAFPMNGFAWDLNYRGDLVFLDQARSQRDRLGLLVEDGWTYFLHGWTQVMMEVFDIPVPATGPIFEHLSSLARSAR
jgi:shikimate 5-dehydrogenase